jgi:hypothetical protein
VAGLDGGDDPDELDGDGEGDGEDCDEEGEGDGECVGLGC